MSRTLWRAAAKRFWRWFESSIAAVLFASGRPDPLVRRDDHGHAAERPATVSFASPSCRRATAASPAMAAHSLPGSRSGPCSSSPLKIADDALLRRQFPHLKQPKASEVRASALISRPLVPPRWSGCWPAPDFPRASHPYCAQCRRRQESPSSGISRLPDQSEQWCSV